MSAVRSVDSWLFDVSVSLAASDCAVPHDDFVLFELQQIGDTSDQPQVKHDYHPEYKAEA